MRRQFSCLAIKILRCSLKFRAAANGLRAQDTPSCVVSTGVAGRSCRDLFRGFVKVYLSSFRLRSLAAVRTGQATGGQHYCIERHREFAFSVDGHAENVPREFRVEMLGHGIFKCRGDRFAQIDMVAASNSASQYISEPYCQKPEQRRALGLVGLNGCQQLAGFLPSPVAAGTVL